ncbi:uncharacterized protein LOC62_06G008041 [Vanrija pseudolonga]|uniref:Uncharacterized protein n=1 Tax=Vanrija pseudolonga TaxID=143232 RepID=A0AAF1BPX0_9TREE|nr:hypothetical protein LOC62_06G008041 [Vanrija pseudolonga]
MTITYKKRKNFNRRSNETASGGAFLVYATNLKDWHGCNGSWDGWMAKAFTRSLPNPLGQRLYKEWEYGPKQTWPDMVAIGLNEARFLDKEAEGNAQSTISEGSTGARSANHRPRGPKRQRQLKLERLAWPGNPDHSGVPPTDAPREAMLETGPVHTGTGIRPWGSSTFFVSQYGTHSIVNNGGLLINMTRLDPPALFAPPGAEDHPEARLIKATHVGLLVLRRSSGINISIPEVYLCPKASNNLLGTNAMTRGKFSYDPDAHFLTHGPSKTRFLIDDAYRSFILPHYGPGMCHPVEVEDGVSYCLDVCKVDPIAEEDSRALSPTPELNEIDEIFEVD